MGFRDAAERLWQEAKLARALEEGAAGQLRPLRVAVLVLVSVLLIAACLLPPDARGMALCGMLLAALVALLVAQFLAGFRARRSRPGGWLRVGLVSWVSTLPELAAIVCLLAGLNVLQRHGPATGAVRGLSPSGLPPLAYLPPVAGIWAAISLVLRVAGAFVAARTEARRSVGSSGDAAPPD